MPPTPRKVIILHRRNGLTYNENAGEGGGWEHIPKSFLFSVI